MSFVRNEKMESWADLPRTWFLVYSNWNDDLVMRWADPTYRYGKVKWGYV